MAEIYVSAAEIRNKVLNALIGRVKNVAIGAGAAYLGLSSTAPSYTAAGEITGITEPTAAGYARRLLGLSDQPATQEMSAASAGKTANAEEIHFDQIPADGSGWGADATHWAIFTAKTGGTPIAAGELTSAITLEAGKVVIIHKGDLSLSMNQMAG